MFSCTYVVTFKPMAPFGKSLVVAVFVVEVPMPSWVCQWKPFWIPVGESFKKAFLEEWVFVGDSSDEQKVTDFPVLLHSTCHTDYIRDGHPPTPRPSRHPVSLPWEPTRPQDKTYFWERIEAPLPPLQPRPRCNFNCPFQMMKYCQATKMLSPQKQINLLHGSRWTLTRSWYIIWLMFKKLP